MAVIAIGAKLKRLRLEGGYSQQFVAKKLGMSQPSYSKMEADKTSPALKTVERICTFYKLSLVAFLLEYDRASVATRDKDPFATADANEVVAALRDHLQQLEQRIYLLERIPKRISKNVRRKRR